MLDQVTALIRTPGTLGVWVLVVLEGEAKSNNFLRGHVRNLQKTDILGQRLDEGRAEYSGENLGYNQTDSPHGFWMNCDLPPSGL